MNEKKTFMFFNSLQFLNLLEQKKNENGKRWKIYD